MFDLLLKGGLVVDPSQGIQKVMDVAFKNGKVQALSTDIGVAEASAVIDASNKIVTPGLVDMHVHTGPVGHWLNADAHAFSGPTTVVDVGSYSYKTFPLVESYLRNQQWLKVFIYLNPCPYEGSTSETDYSKDIKESDLEAGLNLCLRKPDIIKGVKTMLSRRMWHPHSGRGRFEAARRLSDEAGLPLMVHGIRVEETKYLDGFTLQDILAAFRAGDVLTHCYGKYKGITAWDAIDEAKDALKRGVILDVGHGAGSFSWDAAEEALSVGVKPTIISTDLHEKAYRGPVYDLPTTMSKFLHLGLSLSEVVEKTTVEPAKALGEDLGSFRPGSVGDACVIKLEEGKYPLHDSYGEERVCEKLLTPVVAIKSGVVHLAGSWRNAGWTDITYDKGFHLGGQAMPKK